MSYIISDRQCLASLQRKAKYVPFRIKLDSCTCEESEVTFGHPLYTIVADFFEISPKYADISAKEYDFPIIPDGCASVIMIFNDNKIRGYMCGTVDEIHKITLAENEAAFIARYLPGGVYTFFKEPISMYTNQSCDLSAVCASYDLLVSAFSRATTFSERINAYTKVMRRQYITRKEAHHLLNFCVDKIYENNGNIKISELSSATGFSERYISKLFDQWVGVSPKLYAEIMRFQFSLLQLEKVSTKPNGVLMDAALDSGFFDHAHMNRCYKRFLHCTTGALSKNRFEGLNLHNVRNLIA